MDINADPDIFPKSEYCHFDNGIDIVNVKDLNVELLAPGKIPGRLTLWTASAVEVLEKEKLFR